MVFLIVVSGSHAYEAKVMTRFGQVQGLLSRSTRGRLVAHYLGIPFAQPPVDDFRFRVSLRANYFYSTSYFFPLFFTMLDSIPYLFICVIDINSILWISCN